MTKNPPLVSVVMPTYNHASFICDALQSVLEQTYQKLEIIVINNFSEDDTVEVVKGLKDSRIKLINFRNNGIIAASRNTGLRESRGDLVAFLDSDDVWYPQKLERQVEAFERDPSLLLVGTNAKEFPNGKRRLVRLSKDTMISFGGLLCQNVFVNSSVMIRRDAIKNVGFLDEDCALTSVEDYDYWLRILRHRDGSALFLRNVLTGYRVHQNNVAGARVVKNDFQPLMTTRKKVEIIIEKHRTYDASLYVKAKERNQKVLAFFTRVNDFFNGNCGASQILLTRSVSLRDKAKFLLIFLKSRL